MSEDGDSKKPVDKKPTARWRRAFSATRPRILAGAILVLALSEVGSVIALRQMLMTQLHEEIDTRIQQEIDEFRNISEGDDPETGRPFGSDVEAIFDFYFSREVADEGEVLLSFVDGELYMSERASDATYRLEAIPAVRDRFLSASRLERGALSTPGGDVRYAALPVAVRSGAEAVFVVANLPAFERGEIDNAVRLGIVIAVITLFLASSLVWVITGRILSPLEELADTAEGVTYSELTRRIPVRGPDEVSRLATNFNAMLDRLEEAFAIQRRFADDASHELRTPLTIVRGHLELMGEDAEERRETTAIVMDEIERMERMVTDLLVLAKAGQPTFLNLEEMDVDVLTSDVHTKASALAPRQWSLNQEGRGVIRADRQRLTQAILQLAQNAVQHTTESDGIEIGCAIHGGTARFWVTDTGVGIAPEEHERIFQRFDRGTGRRSGREGAGLGLSIVRTIAEAHGGTVSVRSRPGEGATFTIEVPSRGSRSALKHRA